jgi:antitoxin HigA-1
MNVTELADHMDVSRQSMSKLLNGRQGLSADMAIRFEKAFGLSAETLMRMQASNELAEARAHQSEIEVGWLIAAWRPAFVTASESAASLVK